MYEIPIPILTIFREPPFSNPTVVGGDGPHKPGDLKEWSPPNNFFCPYFNETFSAYVSDNFKQKKYTNKKKLRVKSEQNSIIWSFLIGQFSKIFEYKIDHIKKLKILKFGIFFIHFNTLRIFYFKIFEGNFFFVTYGHLWCYFGQLSRNVGHFPTKDSSPTPPSPPLSFDPVFMDDAECAEWNEK